MKYTPKKVGMLVLAAIAVCLSAPLYAGGSDESSGDTVRLRVMIIDNNQVPKAEGSLTDNRWTRHAEEEMLKRGIELKYSPSGGSLVQHTIMMATNMAPDVTFTHGRLLFTKFASDGGLHDLGPYLDEYGPDIRRVLGDDVLEYGVIEGVQYAIPSRRESTAKNVSFIRNDWLEAVRLPAPTNRQELVEVLRAFKTTDPGNIGADKLVPWGYITDDPGTVFESDFKLFDVMYSFLEHDEYLNVSQSWPMREGFEEFMRWMHELYHEGLIEREFATDRFAEKDRKIVNGEVGFFHVGYNHIYAQTPNGMLINLKQNVPDAEVIPIEVFQNRDGEYRKVLNHPVRYYAFSPEKSQHPEAAVAYLNWLLSEETAWMFTFGVEGEHYELRQGVPVIPDLKHNRETFDYISGYLRILGDYPFPADIREAYKEQREIFDFHGNDDLAEELALHQGFTEPIFTERMPDMMKYGPGLIKICERYWVKMIVEDDFDSVFAEFVDKLHSRNIEAIIQERTDYYDRNYR